MDNRLLAEPSRRVRSLNGTWSRSYGAILLALILCGQSAYPQNTTESEVSDGSEPPESCVMEELVTIGTRQASRSILESTVPIELYTSEALESVNSSDLIEVLTYVVPSFNVRRQPISDGASFVRPTHLRSMEAHHTLVLVNNKRRHKSAFMQIGGWGAHGVDIGAIPSIAIDRVEVLRDGAAAQYGSDAIAGVMNFNLRDNPNESLLRVRAAQYTQGDGRELTVEGFGGLELGGGGSLVASFQLSDSSPTSRSQPYNISIAGTGILPHEAVDDALTLDGRIYYGPDAFTYTYSQAGELVQVQLGSDGIPDDLDTRYRDNFPLVGGAREFSTPAQIWGQPSRQQYLGLVNLNVPLNDTSTLYGYTNLTRKDQTGGFFYRRAGISVFRPVRLEDGSIFDPRQELYPAGFTPQFTGEVLEFGGVLGIQQEVWNDWNLDASINLGQGVIEYSLDNTLNPSLGPLTPKSFNPGNLQNEEMALNVDLVGSIVIADRSLGVATGIEHRRERYSIESGDLASYAIGTFAVADPFNFEITQEEVDADPNDALTTIECRIPGFQVVGSLCPALDPIHNALPVGSNGFPGYSPEYSNALTRKSAGLYLDLELELNADWLLNTASRFEHYDGFGGVAVWKLSSRFAVNDWVNLRGSMGTGFRAPTGAQLGTTNVSTRVGPDGLPEAVGLFPAMHPASQMFGSLELQPEESLAMSFGGTFSLGNDMAFTLDAYRIDVDDRLIIASGFVVGPEERAQLIELKVPGAYDVGRVSFFTNDVDTRSSGVDLVWDWHFSSNLGNTSVTVGLNLNSTEFVDRGLYVNDEGEFDLEEGVPDRRLNATMHHIWRAFDFTVRWRSYGAYKNASDASLTSIQEFDAEAMVDVIAAVNLDTGMRLQLGVENLFDTYPQPGAFETCCGRIYRSDSIVPWQGTLINAQLTYGLQ